MVLRPSRLGAVEDEGAQALALQGLAAAEAEAPEELDPQAHGLPHRLAGAQLL